MAARFVFPPAEKSARLTHELEDVASDLKKDHKFGVHRLRYDPAMPLPPVVDGVCDGHRLYIQSARDSRLLNWLNIWLYVLALALLSPAIISVFGKGDTSEFYWGGRICCRTFHCPLQLLAQFPPCLYEVHCL